ncbi:MAG: hypothetical protein FWJ90_23040 [Actinomadura sp.]
MPAQPVDDRLDLGILADGAPAPGNSLVLEGTAAFVEELGDVTYVHLDLADGTRVILRADRKSYTGQSRLRAAAKVGDVLLFGPDGKRLRSQAGRAR